MEGKGDLSGTAIGQLGRLASTCLKRTSSQSNRSGRARTKVRRRVRDDKINGHSSGEDDDVETVKIDCRPNLPKSEEKSELDSLVEIAEATVKEAEALKQSEMEQILLSSAEKPASEQILHVSEGEDDMNENNLKSHPSILQTLNRQSFFSTVTGDDNPVHGSSSKTAASSAQNDRRARFVASWLLTEFEPCVSSTLPRSTLYDRYQEVCVEVGMEPVNAATFGKIIRAVFTHLRTRRLGTRGNSKYHYEGIRPREGTLTATTLASEVSSTGAVGDSSSAEQTNILPNDPGIVSNFAINTGRRKSLDGGRRGSLSIRPTTLPKIAMGGRVPPNTNVPATERLGSGSAVEGSKNDHQPVCWAPLVPNYTKFSRHLEQRCLPNLANTPHGLSPDQLQSFATSYQHHTLEILRRLVSSDGSGPVAADLEATMQRFWHGQILTSTDHLACLHTEEGIRIVLIADDYLYQVIDSRNPNISQVAADVLLRDVLESIPIQATQSIRQFAKSFESMIAGLFPPPTTTTTSIPLTVVRVKRDLAGRFSQVLRRRTSLNHLAQAVRGVLRNPDHSNQMSYDWMHIDFAGIRDQTTAWILVPGDPFLVCIETGFKSYLSDGAALPQWTQWLESIIDQSILMEMTSGETMDTAVRSIILRWSFICSMIIRDLTLRSANSFGSFHLLRLFIDEYILFHLERKLDAHRRAVGMLGGTVYGGGIGGGPYSNQAMMRGPGNNSMLWASGLCDFEGIGSGYLGRQAASNNSCGSFNPNYATNRYPIHLHPPSSNIPPQQQQPFMSAGSFYTTNSTIIEDSESNSVKESILDEYYRKNYSFFGSHGTVVLGMAADSENTPTERSPEVPVMTIERESKNSKELTTILNNVTNNL